MKIIATKAKFIYIFYLFNIISGICNIGGSWVAYSQSNLIINHSFEQADYCAAFDGNLLICSSWAWGSVTTPDYFNPCNLGEFGNPSNGPGYQYPQEGIAYAGLVFADQMDYRESIQGKISPPLEKGHYYCFEMYISPADKCNYRVDRISAYFSQDSIDPIANGAPNNNNAFNPQINIDISSVNDTLEWVKVGGTYLANGDEKFIIISNFQNYPHWIYVDTILGVSAKLAYYYLDNFSLIECLTPEIFIPNIITPNNDGLNDVFSILNLPDYSNVMLYDRWGVLMYENNNYKNDWNGNSAPDGVYYYVIQTPDGKIFKDFFHIFKQLY